MAYQEVGSRRLHAQIDRVFEQSGHACSFFTFAAAFRKDDLPSWIFILFESSLDAYTSFGYEELDRAKSSLHVREYSPRCKDAHPTL